MEQAACGASRTTIGDSFWPKAALCQLIWGRCARSTHLGPRETTRSRLGSSVRPFAFHPCGKVGADHAGVGVSGRFRNVRPFPVPSAESLSWKQGRPLAKGAKRARREAGLPTSRNEFERSSSTMASLAVISWTEGVAASGITGNTMAVSSTKAPGKVSRRSNSNFPRILRQSEFAGGCRQRPVRELRVRFRTWDCWRP